MADMMGNLIQHNLPWTLGMAMFYACAQYYQHGGPTPPSKSKWFWTAAKDDAFIHGYSPRTTDTFASTLQQTLAVPTMTVTSGTTTTIKVTPSVSTETITSTPNATNWRMESLISTITFTSTATNWLTESSTSTTTIKSCTSTVHPFARTVTQSVSVDITTTETTTVKPTFTKTITETAQPTKTVYSDSAPPGFLHSNTWSPYVFYLVLALALGYCARLQYQLSRFKMSKLYKEHEDKKQEMQKKWEEARKEIRVKAKEVMNREKKANDREQKLQQEIMQIKSDADLKVAEASRELNSLKPKLEFLGDIISDDGMDTLDVTSMSLSLEEFEESLTEWLDSKYLKDEDVLKKRLEEANRVGESLMRQRDQANAQLNRYAKEMGGHVDLEVINYDLRHANNTLHVHVSELGGKLEEARRQIKELREGTSRMD
jgi:hypothetical protein